MTYADARRAGSLSAFLLRSLLHEFSVGGLRVFLHGRLPRGLSIGISGKGIARPLCGFLSGKHDKTLHNKTDKKQDDFRQYLGNQRVHPAMRLEKVDTVIGSGEQSSRQQEKADQLLSDIPRTCKNPLFVDNKIQ